MNINDSFKGKTLVITGGTGSFGSTVLKHFLTSEIGEIKEVHIFATTLGKYLVLDNITSTVKAI